MFRGVVSSWLRRCLIRGQMCLMPASFSPDPRADQRAGRIPRRRAADHRSPRPGVRAARARGAQTACGGSLQTAGAVAIYPRPAPAPGRRRSSTRCRPATAADVRDRLLRRAVARHGAALGLQVDFVPGDWATASIRRWSNRGSPRIAGAIGRGGRANETSTGVTTRIPAVRRAMDAAATRRCSGRCVPSLGSIDYRHDDWGATSPSAARRRA